MLSQQFSTLSLLSSSVGNEKYTLKTAPFIKHVSELYTVRWPCLLVDVLFYFIILLFHFYAK